jgi:hypothetical protein
MICLRINKWMEGIEEQRSSLLLNISGCNVARLSFVSLAPPRYMQHLVF